MMSDIRKKVALAICQAGCDIKNCSCHYADGDQEIKEADAAITAFLEAADKEGWHMRPDEATHLMTVAANKLKAPTAWPEERYRAMLDTAPKFEWKDDN